MNAKLYRSEECHCLNNIEPLKMKVYSKIADISKWDTDTQMTERKRKFQCLRHVACAVLIQVNSARTCAYDRQALGQAQPSALHLYCNSLWWAD